MNADWKNFIKIASIMIAVGCFILLFFFILDVNQRKHDVRQRNLENTEIGISLD